MELSVQASKLNDAGDYASAETALEGALGLRARCLEAAMKLEGGHGKQEDWSLATAKLQGSLAFSKTALSKHEEANALYEQCLPIVESFEKEARDRGVLLMNYAETLTALKRTSEAVHVLQMAIQILKKYHKDDEMMASALANLAGYYCLERKYHEAKGPAAQSLNMFLKRLGKRNEFTKQAWNNYYCILKELKLDEEAQDLETDWRTQHEGPSSKLSEKLNDTQVEDIRRRLEERLQPAKRAEPAGSTKDNTFYREELNDFMKGWQEAGLDLSDPAHESALRKELAALQRGSKQSNVSLQRETERIATTAQQNGEDWDAILRELDTIQSQAEAIDSNIADERLARQKAYMEQQASKPKTKPGPSKELLAEIERMKIEKAEKARAKAEAERIAAEAAAKAAAEAAAKGKGKKKR